MAGRGLLLVVLLLAMCGPQVLLFASDPKPIVGPGATKDAVIDAYGWPTGQSQAGTKEILNYPQGTITLENGRVERVDFSMNVPWPAPRPRPGPPAVTPVRPNEPAPDFWVTDFEQAAREAERRNARILALFTGTDWSPASKQFHDEVEFHPDFVNAFTGDFVFLRLDFTTRAPLPAELREQNARLRERYGVTVYPTLLVLSPTGTVLANVDLAKPQSGDTYRARVIAAVREVRDLLMAQPPAPVVAEPQPVVSEKPVPPAAVTASLKHARSLVVLAVAIGLSITLLLLWLVWRTWPTPDRAAPAGMAERIADAAAGMPTHAQLAMWPKEKVRGVTAALAEAEGYVVEAQPPGGDKDLVLKRPGEKKPRVLVCCASGQTGVVTVKRVRELFATLAVEGVSVGWFVSPAGFAADARAFAEQQGIVLVDGARLAAQLRDLPPLVLPKVLARMI